MLLPIILFIIFSPSDLPIFYDDVMNCSPTLKAMDLVGKILYKDILENYANYEVNITTRTKWIKETISQSPEIYQSEIEDVVAALVITDFDRPESTRIAEIDALLPTYPSILQNQKQIGAKIQAIEKQAREVSERFAKISSASEENGQKFIQMVRFAVLYLRNKDYKEISDFKICCDKIFNQ